MLRDSKVAGNIDDESSMLMSKFSLTKNEYNATVRNKIEYNRLKVIHRHMDDEFDSKNCKLRRAIYGLKQELDDNQQIVWNVNEYFINRKVKEKDVFFCWYSLLISCGY
jgi:hypothetical protein